ncbi:MAG TPA: O-antigen ligase family protein [Thermoanaerobaculia bacterium]|nr:O-antigen ligase family protein [Thermoanaerobaculia bacterium]
MRSARFVPPLLLALFGGWCGTFGWGATFLGWATAIAAVLGTLLAVGAPWRDSLSLGTAGRWLPPALWVTMAASAWASPVPRAGLTGVVLLPAFLWLPAAVEHCWSAEDDRRQGLRAVAAVVTGMSLWALVDLALLGASRETWRAIMPLGHHNLLATWMVILLPLAGLSARERGLWRALAFTACLLGVAVVLATRSLAGSLALTAEVCLILGGMLHRLSGSTGRRLRLAGALLALLMLVVALVQVPRVKEILKGNDLSVRARTVYYAAAWEGFLARPVLGWGPGSAAWTAASFLDPAPGVRPWGEAVGELHSLPLQVAYESGATGLLLALAVAGLFGWRRLARRGEARDPMLVAAGLLGLLGAAVASLGSGALAVTALPLAAAVAAGAALAGGEVNARGSTLPSRIYAVAAGMVLLPAALALSHYDRALAHGTAGRQGEARWELTQAVRLDPSFPLYRMRLALLQEGAAAARLALQAAQDSHAVPVLWLIAGLDGYRAGEPSAREALSRACNLDPLGGFAPFYLMLSAPESPQAPAYGAHALLAEPRLAAAVFLERQEELFQRTLHEAQAWPGLSPSWREALPVNSPAAAERTGERAWLGLGLDTTPSLALSLHTFRRRPWPTWWEVVEVHRLPAERLQLLPPAFSDIGQAAPRSCSPL